MINDLLNYDFKIYQGEDDFKFSIDSVLLAEFVNINFRCKNIIDLCTGNAPIPMILSTKFEGNIIGVEIQKYIFDNAKNSVELNNINNIHLVNDDANNIIDKFDFKFDIVTCNPPYFKYNNKSIINKSDSKAIARHEIMINLEDVVRISSNLLKDSGSLNIVHRCDRFMEILELLKKYRFGLRRIQFVYDNKNSNCCFLLIEAKYKCKDDLKVLKPLYIKDYLEAK